MFNYRDQALCLIILTYAYAQSLLTSAPFHGMKIFIKTFEKFPDYKFIWEFNGDLSMFEIPRNIIVFKGLPQVDLFGNYSKRVKRRGVALIVQKTVLSIEKWSEALENNFEKPKPFPKRQTSILIRKKRGKQSELVRQWIEYITENGGLGNLEPALIDMNFLHV
uniref:Uncharacterized protein n=1 Tax=Romanomermis culicivorax TaxID=13658 RepID=A0A915HRT1_ROMCU